MTVNGKGGGSPPFVRDSSEAPSKAVNFLLVNRSNPLPEFVPPRASGGGGGGPGGQQEIRGGGGGDGGAAEEMDQDGSDVGGSSRGASGAHGGAATPENWEQMSRTQRRDWHMHRRRREKARAVGLGLSRNA